MWATILSVVIGALRAFLGAPKPAPSVADLAAREAAEEANLHEEQAANDVLEKGAAARAGADARSLPGSGAANAVTVDPAAPVNRSPNAHFRD